MIVKAELKKPCSAKERADFIVRYNHRSGLLIEEDDVSIRALDDDDVTKLEKLKAAKAEEVRARRNTLLAETDYLMTRDYPLTEEQEQEVRAYRQALRDLPSNPKFPDVEFPTKPSFIQ